MAFFRILYVHLEDFFFHFGGREKSDIVELSSFFVRRDKRIDHSVAVNELAQLNEI